MTSNSVNNTGYDLEDISWLTHSIDVKAVLQKAGVRITAERGDQLCGYCPDHVLFVNKEPSHPKWYVNTKTGKCHCKTEDRGSNIIYTIKRVLRLPSVDDTISFMLNGVNIVDVNINRVKNIVSSMVPKNEEDTRNIDKLERYINDAELGCNTISFLARHNITPETARVFGCVEFEHGYYADRLVFPITDELNKLVGIVATSTLNSEDWYKKNVKKHVYDNGVARPVKKEDYKKVLYSSGIRLSEHLLGYSYVNKRKDRLVDGEPVFLVEGCRDVMKMSQNGFLTLGVGGAGLSDKQLLLLSRLSPRNVIMMFDGDDAGKKAAENVGKKCRYFFKNVYISNLPRGKDPKDMSREETLFILKNASEKIV